ncbi:hypothetical protein E4U50_000553 [Claviceps purpurea]|nr:hypothetical protein E4U50_000553 [Claviceps purpurea]
MLARRMPLRRESCGGDRQLAEWFGADYSEAKKDRSVVDLSISYPFLETQHVEMLAQGPEKLGAQNRHRERLRGGDVVSSWLRPSSGSGSGTPDVGKVKRDYEQGSGWEGCEGEKEAETMEVSNKDGGRSRMPADEAGDKEAERPWKCANWRTGLELVSFPSGCVGSAREKALTVTGAGAGSRTGIGWDWRRDCSWSLGGGDD